MKKPMMKKGMAYKMGYTKKEMMKGEDTLQTMKKMGCSISKHMKSK